MHLVRVEIFSALMRSTSAVSQTHLVSSVRAAFRSPDCFCECCSLLSVVLCMKDELGWPEGDPYRVESRDRKRKVMRHLLRRVLFYLVALWASATMNFLIPRLMPGDPALAYVAKMQGQNGISAQTLQNIRIQFGLSDDPL